MTRHPILLIAVWFQFFCCYETFRSPATSTLFRSVTQLCTRYVGHSSPPAPSKKTSNERCPSKLSLMDFALLVGGLPDSAPGGGAMGISHCPLSSRTASPDDQLLFKYLSIRVYPATTLVNVAIQVLTGYRVLLTAAVQVTLAAYTVKCCDA